MRLATTLALTVTGFALIAADAPVPKPKPAAYLTEAEARAVLGVPPDADEAQIRAAWKHAMSRVHPDQGGTAGLAIRVNAARDRLLKKNRGA